MVTVMDWYNPSTDNLYILYIDVVYESSFSGGWKLDHLIEVFQGVKETVAFITNEVYIEVTKQDDLVCWYQLQQCCQVSDEVLQRYHWRSVNVTYCDRRR